MMNILYFHSILRYFVLLFMLLVILQSLSGMLGKKAFKKIDKTAALVLMIICDVQLLLGLCVYMINGWMGKLSASGGMKDHVTRFFGLEHPLLMIIALVLVHIGYGSVKKNIADDRKYKMLFWCTVVALFLVLARIPWPGMKEVGRPFLPLVAISV